MQPLRDFLATRRSEIEAQLKALKDELRELRMAEAAISGPTPASAPKRPRAERGNAVRDGSIKWWILKALREFEPNGLQTEDVIQAVEAMGGPEVPRNSMTPQLSRLKSAGVIEQQGRHWRQARDSSVQEVLFDAG